MPPVAVCGPAGRCEVKLRGAPVLPRQEVLAKAERRREGERSHFRVAALPESSLVTSLSLFSSSLPLSLLLCDRRSLSRTPAVFPKRFPLFLSIFFTLFSFLFMGYAFLLVLF